MKKILAILMCMAIALAMTLPAAEAASAAPKLIAVYNSANGADIRFSPVSGAEQYTIMRKYSGKWNEVTTVNAADLKKQENTLQYIDGEVRDMYGKGFIYSVAIRTGGELSYDKTGLALYRLEKPEISSVSIGTDGKMAATWDKVDAHGYELQYSVNNGESWTKVKETTGLTVASSGFDPKGSYVFRLRCYKDNEDRGRTYSQYSEWAKPSDVSEPVLTAVYNSAKGADIRWRIDSSQTYVIMRKENGVWSEIRTVNASSLAKEGNNYKYVDEEVKTRYGKGFIYSVAAKDSNGKLLYDTTGLALYRLTVPEIKNVKREATDDFKSTVVLSWTKVDCHGYEVQVSLDGGNSWESVVETTSSVVRMKGFSHECDCVFRIRSQKTNPDRGTTWSQYSSWKMLQEEAHSWIDATCTEPRRCRLCGKKEGEALGHTYFHGVCIWCGKEKSGIPSAEDGNIRIAVVYPSLSDFWDMCGRGGQKRLEELRTEYPKYQIELECTGPSEKNVSAQIQIIDSLIDNGYQGMIIAPVDAEGITSAINKAVDAGMFVLTMETDCPDSKRAAFIGTHNERFGRKLAQFAVDWVDGGPKVIVLHGTISQLGMIQRLKGVVDVISENSGKGAELLDYQSPVNTNQAQAIVESMMLSNPAWNSVICTGSNGSAVSAVFEENGWNDAATSHSRCSILSDDSAQVINAIKDRFATCTLVQKQWQWTYYGVDFMFKKIALEQDPSTDFYETSTFYVTLDNVYDDDMYPTRQ